MKILIVNCKKLHIRRLLKIIVILIVLILVYLPFSLIDYEDNIVTDFSNEIDENLKISGISKKIHINNNWSQAKADGICTGSGTYVDPYVIEDVLINAEGIGSCISIENSYEYFKIINCTLQYSEFNSYFVEEKHAGIKLNNAHNGTIHDNEFSLHRSYGIYLVESMNNTISENLAHQEGNNLIIIYNGSRNNKIINNTLIKNDIFLSGMNNTLSENKVYGAGIYLDGNITECVSHKFDTSNKANELPIYYYANEIGLGPNNFTGAGQIILVNTTKSLISNLEIFNSSTGISLYYSHNNKIEKNNLSSHENAIALQDSYDNTIIKNQLTNNFGGLLLHVNSNNNTISKNNITLNSIGIYVQDCHNNSIRHNNITSNQGEGIISYYNTFNNFSHNYISFNGQDGVYVAHSSHNNTFMNNVLESNKEKGIYISDSFENSLYQNIISDSELSGIEISSSQTNNLSGNLMYNCGLLISSYLIETHSIDTTNKVNDKTLYYYVNESGLTPSNFSNAGQIILSNCQDSLISDVDVSHGTWGIILYGSNGNTIMKCNSSFNSLGGISLGTSHENIIINNDVKNNSNLGIFLDYSSNNTIQNNNVSYNKYYLHVNIGGNGIRLSFSDNNSIIENNLFYNTRNGIEMDWCKMNNLSNNNMVGCGLEVGREYDHISSHFIDTTNKVNGKSLYYYVNKIGLTPSNFMNAGQIILYNCNDSLISNVDVSSSSSGITLFACVNISISFINSSFNNGDGLFLSGCYNCSILKNILVNNQRSGIYMRSSDNNIIKENELNSNSFCGIFFQSNDYNILSGNYIINNAIYGVEIFGLSRNNSFYYNKFIGNGHYHVHGEGWDSEWDDGKIGNYWDNYTGVDGNNDGIGDTPHFVFGDSYDNFPILDITSPEITILTPNNEDNYGSQAPEFSVKISDPHLDKMWYTINDGSTCNIFTTNGTIDQTLWDGVPEGNVTIRFFANDTIGNVNYQEITIIKTISQSKPPEIPGYNIFFLVGFISVMVAIIIKKRIYQLN